MELVLQTHVFEKYRKELSPLDGSVMEGCRVNPEKLSEKIKEKGDWFHNDSYDGCKNPVLCFVGHKEVYAGRIENSAVIIHTCYRYKRHKHDSLRESLEPYEPHFT